jgi:predicted RNase H-like HicB family nuclease
VTKAIKRYPVIYEKSANGWGAYIPGLPGCVALGLTLDENEAFDSGISGDPFCD